MSITQAFLEQLLHKSEGETLDFKEKQYSFSKECEDSRSELLKDILAFANTRRQSEAYILIGVREVTGGSHAIVGIDVHLPEHSLQQFVNTKTNRPISFSYETVNFQDKTIGVIIIQPRRQEDSFYLKQGYGKLNKNIVYVRQGSSTKELSPDEFVDMMRPTANLEVQFYDPQSKRIQGTLFNKRQFFQFPQREELPSLPHAPHSDAQTRAGYFVYPD